MDTGKCTVTQKCSRVLSGLDALVGRSANFCQLTNMTIGCFPFYKLIFPTRPLVANVRALWNAAMIKRSTKQHLNATSRFRILAPVGPSRRNSLVPPYCDLRIKNRADKSHHQLVDAFPQAMPDAFPVGLMDKSYKIWRLCMHTTVTMLLGRVIVPGDLITTILTFLVGKARAALTCWQTFYTVRLGYIKSCTTL